MRGFGIDPSDDPGIGRNDTLARERAVFGGILWRKLAGRRGGWKPRDRYSA